MEIGLISDIPWIGKLASKCICLPICDDFVAFALRNRQMRDRLETELDRNASFPSQWELEQFTDCNNVRSVQVQG